MVPVFTIALFKTENITESLLDNDKGLSLA